MLSSPLSAYSFELIIDILSLVIEEKKPLDRAYSISFSGQKLASSDQAKITIVVGDIMRRLNLYCYLADIDIDCNQSKITFLVNIWHKFHQIEMPKFVYGMPINEENYTKRLMQAKALPALWDGCPEWLDKIGQAQLQDNWPAERKALSTEPKRYLRCNSLKINTHELIAKLANEEVEAVAVDGVDSGLEVVSNSALFRTQCFKEGLFEQQDAGSQLVSAAVDAKPGMRVIDACAGAGGKTLHIAAQMQGKGRLLAMDIEQWKLDNLKERARRAGAFNVETRIIKSSKTIKRLKLTADRLLLDVPCSGLGVLKRNPDTKWRDTAERLPILVALQAQIIDSYSRMLKVGGIMIYATCSIMPEENREQVDAFLANHPNFELIEDKNITPATSGFDGFYFAKLVRTAE